MQRTPRATHRLSHRVPPLKDRHGNRVLRWRVAMASRSSTQNTHFHEAAMVIHNNKKPVANRFATGLISPGICSDAPPRGT
jgi:hypothetical protein